ncbi:uncharacterized protein MELLADRAFT_84354 [Melampsora larici-populina 98AG31]|uniref:PSP1 C-terminal domain-containing protein n=1 Tax=Melampsora larici-populina (strain 98AG31 / pathotype 3-4-7) TaxID=747676 RepID=F4RFG1_MELLP|nr:uncharacterized protein MELLADRAFT_84354 [Melampsora larici-populina 98AG31]EGG08937.1 hypothetical protein MELLADRAFT_84354 [Melampsora larici-populina 98AG31]
MQTTDQTYPIVSQNILAQGVDPIEPYKLTVQSSMCKGLRARCMLILYIQRVSAQTLISQHSIQARIASSSEDRPHSCITASSPRSSLSSNPPGLETPPVLQPIKINFNSQHRTKPQSIPVSHNYNQPTYPISSLSPHFPNTRRDSSTSSSRGSSPNRSASKTGSDRSSSICSVEDPSIKAIWATSAQAASTSLSANITHPSSTVFPQSPKTVNHNQFINPFTTAAQSEEVSSHSRHHTERPYRTPSLSATADPWNLQSTHLGPFVASNGRDSESDFTRNYHETRLDYGPVGNHPDPLRAMGVNMPRLMETRTDLISEIASENVKQEEHHDIDTKQNHPLSPSGSIFIDNPVSQLQNARPFGPIRPQTQTLRTPTDDHASHASSSAVGSSALDDNIASLRPNSYTNRISQIGRLSLDSINAKPFQPASLSVPTNKANHMLNNIWAQPVQTPTSSSSGASDFDLHSPLASQPPLAGPRSDLLGSHLNNTQSLIGSPSSMSPTSPGGGMFGPNSLPAAFYGGPWHGSSSNATNQQNGSGLDDERAGRSKARDILGARPTPIGRDSSVGSIGSPGSSSVRSGIGLSNMSPFTGTSLLPSSSIAFGGPFGATHHASNGFRSSRIRDSSLGAIGTGRTNLRPAGSTTNSSGAIGTGLGLGSSHDFLSSHPGLGGYASSHHDSWFLGGRSLSNDLDEDDEFAPPTKSGATSRRHSVAAFSGRSLVQDFDYIPAPRPYLSTNSNPISEKKTQHAKNGTGGSVDSIGAPDHARMGSRQMMFGSGALALTEDDLLLSSDLNSLNLHDLEDHHRAQDNNHSPSFEFHHSSHTNQPTRPFHRDHVGSVDQQQFNLSSQQLMMPWCNQPPQLVRGGASGVVGPAFRERKSSFSAGDPFSASAQAAKFFASQAAGVGGQQQQENITMNSPLRSRFPFGHAGNGSQAPPTSALSGPPVTTFSNSGLLSTQSTQHGHHAGSIGSGLDPATAPTFYPNSAFHPQATSSPLLGPSGNGTFGAIYSASTPGPGPHELGELGKGVPLHSLSKNCKLYIVEFKGARKDLFYFIMGDGMEVVRKGDMVIVEADRGKDLGKVIDDEIMVDEVVEFQQRQLEIALEAAANKGDAGGKTSGSGGNAACISRMTKEIHPKRIYGKATIHDTQLLQQKIQDENKAFSQRFVSDLEDEDLDVLRRS